VTIYKPPWPPTPKLPIPKKLSIAGIIVWVFMCSLLAHAKFTSGCPSYYGPWGLSALGDRERAKYVRNDCPIPEPAPGYRWSEDYRLVKDEP
jgi:hypothetical protein